jgi:hypothetical protein
MHTVTSIQVILQEYTSQTSTSGCMYVLCMYVCMYVCSSHIHIVGRVTFSFVMEQNTSLDAQVPYLATLCFTQSFNCYGRD